MKIALIGATCFLGSAILKEGLRQSSGKINPGKLITHHFKLEYILKAYEVFGNASKEKTMKVIIEV